MTVSKRMAGLSAFVVIVSVGIGACSKKPPTTTPAPPPPEVAAPVAPPAPPPPPPPAPPPTPTTVPLTEEQIFAQKSVDQLNAERPLTDVFFNLDEASIGEAGRGSLQKNADWMKRWGSTRITVEGHCDERGTEEYNLALGERRAKATAEFLAAQGIATSRVTTISYGKERPQCTERSEACWAKNRRAHFLVKRG